MRCRNSSQLGHPSSRKRCRDLGGQQWFAFLVGEKREETDAVCHDDGADHAGAQVALLAGGDEAGHAAR